LIGQFTTSFGEKDYVGTGTLIWCSERGSVGLTAAHNFVMRDESTDQLVNYDRSTLFLARNDGPLATEVDATATVTKHELDRSVDLETPYAETESAAESDDEAPWFHVMKTFTGEILFDCQAKTGGELRKKIQEKLKLEKYDFDLLMGEMMRPLGQNDDEEDLDVSTAAGDMNTVRVLLKENYICKCGSPFEERTAGSCYKSRVVVCDHCSQRMSGEDKVLHCPKKPDHRSGFDFCEECAKQLSEEIIRAPGFNAIDSESANSEQFLAN